MNEKKHNSSDDIVNIAINKRKVIKYLIFISVILLIVLLGVIYFTYFKTIEEPKVLLSSGEYNSPQLVTIETPPSGMSVYYSLDGSDPDLSSAKYIEGNPIPITTTTTFKCLTADNKGNKSKILTLNYIINNSPEVNASNSVESKSNAVIENENTEIEFNTEKLEEEKQTLKNSTPNIVSTEISTFPSVDSRKMQKNFNVTTSSSAGNNGGENLIDNSTSTAWISGNDQNGINDRIELKYIGDSPLEVNEIFIQNGYGKNVPGSEDYTYPVKIGLYKDKKRIANLTLQTSQTAQQINLSEPVILEAGDTLIFSIEEIEGGLEGAKPAAIAEIGIETN